DHVVELGYLRRNASGFVEPAPTFWCSSYGQVDEPAPAPELGADSIGELLNRRPADEPGDSPTDVERRALPFAGLRVVDFTAFWAGPIVGNYLATLGAEVIKVESAKRLDGIRYQTKLGLDEPNWWEFGGLFQGVNTNKRSVTIDMSSGEGRAVAERLIANCDVVIENFSPRVLESWGLGYERIREINPATVLVRMPAYGLDGPWRDWTGYAQTIEMVSGMTWMTGFPDAPPTVPNGPCDPIAGTHSTLALIAALMHRRRTGEGGQVTAPMVGGGLRVCAEQVVEASAYGNVRGRDGNRSPDAAPQGVYLAADTDRDGASDRWVAISVVSDDQWRELRRLLGDPTWAGDPDLDSLEGRRAGHDFLDERLAAWCAQRSAASIVEALLNAGIPAAVAVLPHEAASVDQLRARGFFETTDHPLIGKIVVSGYPGQFERIGAWQQRPAPLLGADNHAVLTAIAGLDDTELAELERRGVVGGVPVVNSNFTA
ncbi:MAG: CaiB/BaiF CoA transferase family protein, partial [Acidimicrobiia bacterium]